MGDAPYGTERAGSRRTVGGWGGEGNVHSVAWSSPPHHLPKGEIMIDNIRVGTASWTDKTLVESGWYPPEVETPEERLRYYAT
jgi:hypothetical protein